MTLDDSVTDGKSKTSSLADRLGGKKWIENMRDILGRNTRPVVGKAQKGLPAIDPAADVQARVGLTKSRIAGILDKIHYDLLQLAN